MCFVCYPIFDAYYIDSKSDSSTFVTVLVVCIALLILCVIGLIVYSQRKRKQVKRYVESVPDCDNDGDDLDPTIVSYDPSTNSYITPPKTKGAKYKEYNEKGIEMAGESDARHLASVSPPGGTVR